MVYNNKDSNSLIQSKKKSVEKEATKQSKKKKIPKKR